MSIGEGAKALIEEELLSGAALGIAKKIAATNSMTWMSEKQKQVYEQVIAPHFMKSCQTTDCPFEIEIDFIADAIRAEAAGDSVICQHCIYVGEQNSKDD
jgi:hypothetical protein